MEFTGERYVPAVDGEIRQEHMHRYAFAAGFVSGKRVLDVACGEGYGSALLAASAAAVVGVDIDPAAIAHATATYAGRANLRFTQGDVCQLPLEDGCIDVIVSFETIEHHDRHESMMLEFRRTLTPTGLLILSSPNKAIYSDEAGYVNEFHVKELYFEQLDALVRSSFRSVAYLGQRFTTASTLYPLHPAPDAVIAAGQTTLWIDDGSRVAARQPALQSPLYFVLLASNAGALPALATSLLLSEHKDLYLEAKKVARWASGIHDELTAARLAWQRSEEDLRSQLAAQFAGVSSAAAARQLLQRTHEAGSAQAQATLSRQAAEFQNQLLGLQTQLAQAHTQVQASEHWHHAAQALSTEAFAEERTEILRALGKAEEAARETARGREDRLDAARQQVTDLQGRLQAALAQVATLEISVSSQANLLAHAETQLKLRIDELNNAAGQLQERLVGQAAEHEAAKASLNRAASAQLQNAVAQGRRQLAAALRQGRRRDRSARMALAMTHEQQAQVAREGLHREDVWTDRVRAMDAAHTSARAKWEAARLQLQRALLASETVHGLRLRQLTTDWQSADQSSMSLLSEVLANTLHQAEGDLRRHRARLFAGPPHLTPGARLHRAGAEPMSEKITAMTQPLALSAAQSVDQLLVMDDTDFIQAAYQALLGRPVDAAGLSHYRAALAQGRSRLQVLADLRYSSEGRQRPVALQGFASAMRKRRLSRLPLLGALFSATERTVSAADLRRDIAALSMQVNRVDAALQERLLSTERNLQIGIQALAHHTMNVDKRVASRLSAVDEAMSPALRRLTDGAAGSDERLADLRDRSGSAVHDAILELTRQMQVTMVVGALRRHEWPPETDLWAEARKLTTTEPEHFVRELFTLTLARVPHGYELAYFTEQLAHGASHMRLLTKVLDSPEFISRHPLQVPRSMNAAAQEQQHTASWSGPLPSLPIYAQPRVSVIIPVYGKLDFTLQCLRSIARHPPAVPYEIIVVNDCSPDDSAQVLAGVPGLRLVNNAQNMGFIRSCNHGASVSRGEFLCMLNNDTEVTPRWLDELHATFDLFPGTGLVGSKLLYPDGTLQEAGGIIWQDGSAWNFGRGQDPGLPGFNYAREVDYCSGASIMIPAALFRRFGGFDEHYLPAYCEDSDLALKVRQAGLRVIYQPMSEVVHYEGTTSGTDTGSGVKAYQVTNTQKLFERWQDHLRSHQPNAVDVDRAKDRMATRRVLVLDIVTPTPNQDAGSVTVVNFLTLLREMRFQATFVAEDNFLYLPDYTRPMQRNGVEVLYAPHITSVEQHLAECGNRYDMVLIWRPAVADKHLATVRRMCPRAKVVYHTVDLHYLRMEREAELHREPARLAEAARMKAIELSTIQAVDSAIVHSTHELEVLAEEIPVANVFVFPLIIAVPGSTAIFAERSGVAFVGGYQHPPNVDAARYFANEVMPLLRLRIPGIRFHVIGSKPPAAVTDLACEDVKIEGFVEELQPVLDRMRISVAPLRYGAGIKGKVGNSMAMGLPVVATRVAVEGMGLVDRRDILIADGPQAMTDAICELYTDEVLWRQLQTAGVERVEALWGATASYDNLRRLVGGLGMEVPAAARALRLYRDSREERSIAS